MTWRINMKTEYEWLRHSWNTSYSLPVSQFNTCSCCNRYGTPKKVTYRPDVYRWDTLTVKEETKSDCILCMSCWNKVRAINNKRLKYLDTKRLINKLYKGNNK